MGRLFASVALLVLTAAVGGCAVAPAYDYGYAQPYYPGYGYAYGAPYAPVYGTIGIWSGWGGRCCYGGDHWRGGGWHGGHGGNWHGGGYGGSRGGSSWSGGGWHGGGRSH